MQRRPVIKEVATEVIKEVPVEKVVKVEVPVEIIKKEIVHVPLYTEDKSLLKLAENHSFDEQDLKENNTKGRDETKPNNGHSDG
ncbi:hypothetical protein A3749_26155 [Oleiphilus sp. HI0078]|nr:hypothetical protein A3749_26155 [Oleiphilus sp. HI0078]